MSLLLCLFPLITQCMLIELKQKTAEPRFSLYERKLNYEKDLLAIKKNLKKRRNSYLIRGWSPAASVFFYSIYTAKTGADFDRALMAKGEFFIQLYTKEQVKGCSALGIVMSAESVSFAERKNFVQKLLSGIYQDAFDHVAIYKFTLTPKDKEIALFTKFKEFAPAIIQEIYPICHINYEIDILQNNNNYIAELLFWLKFNEKDSLL